MVKLKQKSTKKIVIIIVLMAISFKVCNYAIKYYRCYRLINDIATSYGINDISISFSKTEYKETELNYLNVKSNSVDNISDDKKCEFIKKMQDNEFNLYEITHKSIFIDKVIFDNNKYEINTDGSIYKNSQLLCEGNIHKDEIVVPKSILENPPFVGMEEKYINYTSFGEYTSEEKCIDYYHLRPEKRSSDYIWKTKTGKITAQVYGGKVIDVTEIRNGKVIIIDSVGMK